MRRLVFLTLLLITYVKKIKRRREEVVCCFNSLEPIFVSYSYAKRLSKRAIGFSLSVIDFILKVTTESLARDKACVPRAH